MAAWPRGTAGAETRWQAPKGYSIAPNRFPKGRSIPELLCRCKPKPADRVIHPVRRGSQPLITSRGGYWLRRLLAPACPQMS